MMASSPELSYPASSAVASASLRLRLAGGLLLSSESEASDSGAGTASGAKSESSEDAYSSWTSIRGSGMFAKWADDQVQVVTGNGRFKAVEVSKLLVFRQPIE